MPPRTLISIHAPTRGATSKAVGCASTKSNFNPRSHERSDGEKAAVDLEYMISIHAPTRGATGTSKKYFDFLEISIHAPTRGATFYAGARPADTEFQSTLPREERRRLQDIFLSLLEFQSTLPREERHV